MCVLSYICMHSFLHRYQHAIYTVMHPSLLYLMMYMSQIPFQFIKGLHFFFFFTTAQQYIYIIILCYIFNQSSVDRHIGGSNLLLLHTMLQLIILHICHFRHRKVCVGYSSRSHYSRKLMTKTTGFVNSQSSSQQKGVLYNNGKQIFNDLVELCIHI